MWQMGLGIIKVTVKCCVVQMVLGICERLFLNVKVTVNVLCRTNGPGYL